MYQCKCVNSVLIHLSEIKPTIPSSLNILLRLAYASSMLPAVHALYTTQSLQLLSEESLRPHKYWPTSRLISFSVVSGNITE